MSRPRKWRKVCSLPKTNRFGPLNTVSDPENYIVMTVDEYESIRLIDSEGFTQEECANRMNISRTTVQAMYNNARKKLSDFLVNGKALWIDGGEYRLCDGIGDGCGRRGCKHCKSGSKTDN